MTMYESELEEACLRWFGKLGYEVLPSDHLDPDDVYGERASYEQVILPGRLEAALHALNDDLPVEAIEEAIRRVQRHDAPTLEQNNFDFHRFLTDGVTVELASEEGGIRGHRVQLFDFERPERNDWVVSHQFTVVDKTSGSGQPRRPDVVVWVNGIPLAVIELKNPASEQADIWTAHNSLQTYKRDIPSLFASNEILVISDDVLSRVGSLTAERDRFQPWRAVSSEKDVRVGSEREQRLDRGERLQALIEGVFDKTRLLDLVRSFVTFERYEGHLIKKIAAYHQFHAVRHAVEETVRATGEKGDRRVGVIWHTQGSGKSLTMAFYAGKLVAHPQLENPTLVVLTDRNDLDEQLFGTFSQAQGLLRQAPVQADSREHLRELLEAASGGVFFTTIQKFLPPEGKLAPALSERRNIVVIADEAHRSQYGLGSKVDRKTGEIKYGFAKHMRDALPNASFVGFTGTPVELEDRSTINVFGDHISVYDIQRAVEDGATVPIYYESRVARLALDEAERPNINTDFEEVTEDEEATVRDGLKSQWGTIEALVGTPKRLRLIAEDIVSHFERRNAVLEGGKAMVVCMSRRICVDLYEEIRKLRPDWHSDDDDEGQVKVVMTGSASADPELQDHVRPKRAREALGSRFKDPKDPLRLVLVRDMWLTGFDAPCMHTLYVDKPMRGHNLMQAIARVNRVYGDKPGGLIVDYLGLGSFLKQAMKAYRERGSQQKDATVPQERAAELMIEKLEVLHGLFHRFDYQEFFGDNSERRLDLLAAARQHILEQRTGSSGKGKQKVLDGYDTFMKTVTELSTAAGIAATTDEFAEVRDEIAFFQAVKAGLVKLSPGRRQPLADLGHAVRQIVDSALVTSGVIDVFEAAGLDKPDVSILSDAFLAEVQALPHKDLAAAALERLLRDEIKARGQSNVVQARTFEEMLDGAINKYLSRAMETAQVIQELIDLARELRDAGRKGDELGLTPEEFAFYEALAENESARGVMGDAVLGQMAHELARVVKEKASIDWTRKESVQAGMRLAVKKLLKKYGYPPDAALLAIETVLRQAEKLGFNLADSIPPPGGDDATGDEPPQRDFPYPIAVFDALLKSQVEPAERVPTYLHAIERALVLVVVSSLAWLRREGEEMPIAATALVAETGGRRLSLGTWLELCWRLAALLPEGSDDPLVRCARQFVTPSGKPSDLTKALQREVLPYRNDQGHTVTIDVERYVGAEGQLREHWQTLKTALAPLKAVHLVVRAKLKDFEADGKATYNVRSLTGPNEHFAVEEVHVTGKLDEHWAYWLPPRGGVPLGLTPMFRLEYRAEMGRKELLVPRTLELTPGSKIELCQLIGAHTQKFDIPNR
jgi:type I restriction enzyme, R subunit